MAAFLHRLLAATDGSANGDRALSAALALARRYGSELLLCHAVDRAAAIAACSPAGMGAGLTVEITQSLEYAAQAILTAAALRAKDAGIAATTTILDGRPARTIVECARECGVDAIVMGTQGKRDIERFFIGSTVEGVLRVADVPVFVIPAAADGSDASFGTILVAIDDSDPSDAAAAFALDFAAAGSGARLIVCAIAETNDVCQDAAAYGYDPAPMQEELRTLGAALLAPFTRRAVEEHIEHASVVAEGDPADEIVANAALQHASCIVVGTHGRRGLRRLCFGSVAERVVRRSPLPVVVIRAWKPRAGVARSLSEAKTAV